MKVENVEIFGITQSEKLHQVWSWDITYLRSPVKGQFYYQYHRAGISHQLDSFAEDLL